MKKLIALILAMVMILSLSTTVFALEQGEKFYLRVDLEVSDVYARLVFEDGPLYLQEDDRGLYWNVFYGEEVGGIFTIAVDYTDENGEAVAVESAEMTFADIDGIVVLDEEGFHVEKSYPVDKFDEDGDYQKNVTVYGDYEGHDPDTVICVDIEWGSMDFVYTPFEEWNPVTHTYEPVEGSEGTWALADEYETNGVRVVNHSNADIDVSFVFRDSLDMGITGAFTTDADGTGDVVTGFTLLSADLGSAAGDYELADSNAVFLQITGGSIPAELTDQMVIGHITVTVEVSAEQTA